MLRELIAVEDVFLGGPRVRVAIFGFIEGVDGDSAIDRHRRLIVFPVEHQPSAETSNGRASHLVERGVGPDDGHFRRDDRL
ncbi:MAG: hypothetical protein AB7O26_00710 [Planctomycetaceae bacterium]